MKKWFKSLVSETHPARLAYHRFRGGLAALKADFPARKLKVIGVTGTDGKTTTVSMICHILRAAGHSVGGVSTAFFEINGDRRPNPTQKTSVSATELQGFLSTLVNQQCEFAVVEASSHGLVQGRLSGIQPTVAAITNITMEHLDYHGSMVEYTRAKGRLFWMLDGRGTKVINADDDSTAYLRGIPSEKTIEYSPHSQLTNMRGDGLTSSALLTWRDRSYEMHLPIPGIFNLSNALCAVSCAAAVGVEPEASIRALKNFRGAPGRMERIDAGQSFGVYVDFTVTPIAYQSTLTALRAILLPGKRLLVLTGSCGDRMPEKRPLVGKIVSKYADVAVVSNEDPYTESPETIIDEVISGIAAPMHVYRSESAFTGQRNTSDKCCVRISDRLEAIQFLLRQAKQGDIVLLAGKGADVTMMVGTRQFPWNEREIAMRELKTLSESSTANASPAAVRSAVR